MSCHLDSQGNPNIADVMALTLAVLMWSLASLPQSSSWVCAGTELLLQAEASGRLKEQHTFLYAMAADLRVLDVDKLLSQYKVSTALSAALSVTRSRIKAHHRHITSWHA